MDGLIDWTDGRGISLILIVFVTIIASLKIGLDSYHYQTTSKVNKVYLLKQLWMCVCAYVKPRSADKTPSPLSRSCYYTSVSYIYIVSVVSQSYEVGVLVSSGTQPARRMHSVSRVADHNHLFHRPAVLRDLFTLADPHLLTQKVH